jgi:hypothetical protein
MTYQPASRFWTSSGSNENTVDEVTHLAKVKVAGSNPVFRSILAGQRWFFNLDIVLRVMRPISNRFLLIVGRRGSQRVVMPGARAVVDRMGCLPWTRWIDRRSMRR